MDPGGAPAWVQFWDEVGAYLDFTNPDTIAWWKDRVTTALLDQGIASTWNDNNEFEIWTDQAVANGFGTPFAAWRAKPLQTQLMHPGLARRPGRACAGPGVPSWSRRVGRRGHAPLRPDLVGRQFHVLGDAEVQHQDGTGPGAVGRLQYRPRYRRLSVPRPAAELLIRWVQFGVFMPRFSIHSWNDDGTVNEPWMHPEATPFVRDLIKLRLMLVPYLYTLLRAYHRDYEPVIRPTLYDFPDDPRCADENDEMMLGPSLLAESPRWSSRAPRPAMSICRPARLVRRLVRRAARRRPNHQPGRALGPAATAGAGGLRHPRQPGRTALRPARRPARLLGVSTSGRWRVFGGVLRG